MPRQKTYQKVFRLDDTVEDEYDNIFIPEDELERLSQETREHYLVYFTRQNRYSVFTDFPTKGKEQIVLTGSHVFGPFEQDPGEGDDETEHPSIETVVRAIPVEEMPKDDQFEKIEYLEYGLRREREFVAKMKTAYLSDINKELIKTIGREALQALKRYGLEPRKDEDDDDNDETADPLWGVYSEQLEQALITFEYAERAEKGTGKMLYPRLELKAFGPEGSTATVLQKLGLSRLYRAFSSSESRKLSVEELLRKGFKYNLRQEEITVGEVLDEERVIL